MTISVNIDSLRYFYIVSNVQRIDIILDISIEYPKKL